MDKEELKRLMNTVDGRSFIYNLCLYECGVDLALGAPTFAKDDYERGLKKPAIDLFNLLVYHCYDKMILMIKEQQLRREAND